jgi:hypothetical protein
MLLVDGGISSFEITAVHPTGKEGCSRQEQRCARGNRVMASAGLLAAAP